MSRRLTLLAGSGALVTHLVAVLQRSGDPVQILALSQSGWSPGAIAVDLSDPAEIIAKLKSFRTTHLAFAGGVEISDADREAWLLMADLANTASAGDGALSAAVVALVGSLGIELIGAHQLAPELLAPAGHIAGPPPGADAVALAGFALEQARLAGQLDLGQALVLSGRRAIAAEDIAGTDALLDRVRQYGERGLIADGQSSLILAKARKPGQPDFVDLPAIGPRTVANAAAAGISLIVVEAGQTLLLGRNVLTEIAKEKHVSVIGLPAHD